MLEPFSHFYTPSLLKILSKSDNHSLKWSAQSIMVDMAFCLVYFWEKYCFPADS